MVSEKQMIVPEEHALEAGDADATAWQRVLSSIFGDNAKYTNLEGAYTADQLTAVADSPELFDDVIHRACTEDPENLFIVAKELPTYWHEHSAALELYLELARRHHHNIFVKQYAQTEALVGQERAQSYAREQLIAKPRTLLYNPNAREIALRCMEIQAIRDLLLQTTNVPAGTWVGLSDYIPYVPEVLSEDDFRALTLRILHDTHVQADCIEHIDTLFVDEDSRNAYRQAVSFAYTRAQEPLNVFQLEHLSNVFSEEELSSLLQKRLQQPRALEYYSYTFMKQYLSHDNLASMVRHALNIRAFKLFAEYHKEIEYDQLLGSGERQQMWELLVETTPKTALADLDVYLASAHEHAEGDLVRVLIERVDPEDTLSSIHTWLPMLESTTEGQRAYLLQHLRKLQGVYYINNYVDPACKQGAYLRSLISAEDMGPIVRDKIVLNPEHALRKDVLPSVEALFGSTKHVRDILDDACIMDPLAVLSRFHLIAKYYTPEETEALVTRTATNERDTEAVFKAFEVWHLQVSREFAQTFIQRMRHEAPHLLFEHLDRALQYVPETERATVAIEATWADPAYALSSGGAEHYDPSLTVEHILERLQYDRSTRSFAPRTVKEIADRLASARNMNDHEPQLLELHDLYVASNALRSSPWNAVIERAHETGLIPKAEEIETLGVFTTLAKLDAPLDTMPEYTGLESVQVALVGTLATHMGLLRAIREVEVKHVIGELDSLSPFCRYYLQYEQDPTRGPLLREMFEAMLDGAYRPWKYGTNQGGAEWARTHDYVPHTVTDEQYGTWQHDTESESTMIMASSAEDTRRTLREYIGANISHLTAHGTIPEDVEALQAKVAELGKTIGGLHKEKKEHPERLTELQEDITTAKLAQAAASRSLLVAQILALSSTELTQGYVESDKGKKSKGQKVSALFDQLLSVTPDHDRFAVSHARNLYDELHASHEGDARSFRVIDSSKAQHLFEVGARPVPSCQHYSSGSYNDCLLGYAGPARKVLMALDEQNKPKARAILRLVEDNSGNPALHMERVYKSSASTSLDDVLFAHATKKAGDMGIALYTSTKYRDGEQSDQEGLILVAFERSTESCTSKANRAPTEYVDSAGGRSNGAFALHDLLHVARQ